MDYFIIVINVKFETQPETRVCFGNNPSPRAGGGAGPKTHRPLRVLRVLRVQTGAGQYLRGFRTGSSDGTRLSTHSKKPGTLPRSCTTRNGGGEGPKNPPVTVCVSSDENS
jgi:hypothetical protein